MTSWQIPRLNLRRRLTVQDQLLQIPVLAALLIGTAVLSWAFMLPSASSAAAASLVSPAAAPPEVPMLSPVFTPQVQHWGPAILEWAEAFDLDPDLVATVMQIESCGWQQARSSAGAAGLFQVMPFHFQAGEDLLDPDTNARRGLAYLKASLVKAQGDPVLALAGYNGGHGVIGRDPLQWPAETRRYTLWATGILHEISAGHPSSATLEAWLQAGGSYLCDQAQQGG